MKTQPISILLVEDSPTDALLLNENLQRVTEFVFEMDHAKTLSMAIQKLGDRSYDAILLDLGLTDSTGIKTLDRVRLKAENSPIIVLTGNDDRQLLVESLNNGADNYLIKDAADGNRIAIAILSAIRNRFGTQRS